jgi:hypothetical protein
VAKLVPFAAEGADDQQLCRVAAHETAAAQSATRCEAAFEDPDRHSSGNTAMRALVAQSDGGGKRTGQLGRPKWSHCCG